MVKKTVGGKGSRGSGFSNALTKEDFPRTTFVNALEKPDPLACTVPVYSTVPAVLNFLVLKFVDWPFIFTRRGEKSRRRKGGASVRKTNPQVTVPEEWLFSTVLLCGAGSSPGKETTPDAEGIFVEELVLSNVLQPASASFLFPDDGVTLTVRCGGTGCSPNFFGYYSRDDRCRYPDTAVARFMGTGASFYNLTELTLTLDLRNLYGFYWLRAR